MSFPYRTAVITGGAGFPGSEPRAESARPGVEMIGSTFLASFWSILIANRMDSDFNEQQL